MDILLRVELSVPDSSRDVVVVVTYVRTYAATSTNAASFGWLAGRPPKTPTPAHSLTQVTLDLA